MPKFPKKDKIISRLKKLERLTGSELLSPNATSAEQFKFDLCKKIIVYLHDHDISQRELADMLDVHESRISEIVHYRLDKLTTDRLIHYNEFLYPKISFEVA